MPLLGLNAYQQAVDALIEEKNKRVKAVFINGLTSIAVGTPVDEGFARNNWNLSENSPSAEYSDEPSETASRSIAELSKMPTSVLNKTIYYTNNTPYINKLEYGGYPKPSNGTKQKDGTFDIKTVNGFSDQKPEGWVRSEILTMRKALKAIK